MHETTYKGSSTQLRNCGRASMLPLKSSHGNSMGKRGSSTVMLLYIQTKKIHAYGISLRAKRTTISRMKLLAGNDNIPLLLLVVRENSPIILEDSRNSNYFAMPEICGRQKSCGETFFITR